MPRIDLYGSGSVTLTGGTLSIGKPAQILSFEIDDTAGGMVDNPAGSPVTDTGTRFDGFNPATLLPLDATQAAFQIATGGGMLPGIEQTLALSRALLVTDPVTGSGGLVYEAVEVRTETDWHGNVIGVTHVPIGWIGTFELKPGTAYTVWVEVPVGSAGGGGFAGSPTYAELVGAVCFTAGTMIAAAGGPRRAETILPGDSVLTRDRGLRPVLWRGLRAVGPGELAETPRLRPIRIAAGALGAGRPNRPLRLSPQHRVLIDLGPGTGEVLIAAKHLVGRPGISQDDRCAALVYIHLLLDRHEVLQAEGLGCESLLPGPVALLLLGPTVEAEVRRLVGDPSGYVPVRPIVGGGAFRRLGHKQVESPHWFDQSPSTSSMSYSPGLRP